VRRDEMAAFEEIIAREGVDQETVDAVRSVGERYKYGFSSDIDTEYAPKGVNEDIVRLISEKNGEPEWLTDWRLQAFARWKSLEEPTWAMVSYPKIDFRTSTTTRARRASPRGRSRSTRWTRSCCAPTRSSASRSRSR
jgi:hypothetical protein